MTTGLHATWKMLRALVRLGDARLAVEYECRREAVRR